MEDLPGCATAETREARLTYVYRNEGSNRAEILERYFPQRPEYIRHPGASVRQAHRTSILPLVPYIKQVTIET